MLNILQAENLKGTGTGSPHELKEGEHRPGKTESSFWNSGKKRKEYHLLKKRWETQKDYKDVVRLCRKKIRTKPQQVLNLATATKDN